MKKITLLTATTLILFTIFSCSKDESCSFAKSTFENKTYKITIVKVDSSGNDVTSRYAPLFALDPCFHNTLTFNTNGTYTVNNAANCTQNVQNGVWSVNTTNNLNYFVSDGSSNLVTSFDCNSFTIIETSSPLIITYKIIKI